MSDLIDRQAAIDTIDYLLQHNDDAKRSGHSQVFINGMEDGYFRVRSDILSLPSAQPETHEERTETHACDCISRKKVRYKLTALVNELEEIFANIRERNEDDSVCGLCEYDGAYIGQSGYWCNECPGFDKSDCFKLKDKYRHEWETIDE